MSNRDQAGHAFEVALLGLALMAAVSFAWLFYDQRERSLANRHLIERIRAVQVAGCHADAGTAHAVRAMLATVRDHPPVPLTPLQTRARAVIYESLISSVPVRNCQALP